MGTDSKGLRILPRQIRHGGRAKGGQFFTPTSIVKLIVEIIEPFKGKILDPRAAPVACSFKAPALLKNTETMRLTGSPSTEQKESVNRPLC